VRRGSKLQPKCRLRRPRLSPPHPHARQSPKRTSRGRGQRPVALSPARGRHARSGGVEPLSALPGNLWGVHPFRRSGRQKRQLRQREKWITTGLSLPCRSDPHEYRWLSRQPCLQWPERSLLNVVQHGPHRTSWACWIRWEAPGDRRASALTRSLAAQILVQRWLP
jgi:hypothetical protein